MAGLLERPTTDTPDPAAAPPAEGDAPTPAPDAAVRACPHCAATLAEGQDWCLECGSAQPGRLGGRPGWRAALTVLAVTGVLVGGAGAAAYAALSTDAQRDATAAAPPAAAPTVAPAPVVPAPAPAPAPSAGETPQIPAPKTETPKVPAPKSDTPSVPAPTPTPAPTPSSGGDSSAGGTDTDTPAAPTEPVALDLPADAAATYDPFDRANNAAGDPADAVDGKASTAWEAPVAPDGTVRIGLTLSLGKATSLSDLVLTADTPGFTVEIYATKDPELPPDVLDSRWEHVANRRDAGVEEKVALDGKYRHVLLWVTEQPADTKVAIPEVQLFD